MQVALWAKEENEETGEWEITFWKVMEEPKGDDWSVRGPAIEDGACTCDVCEAPTPHEQVWRGGAARLCGRAEHLQWQRMHPRSGWHYEGWQGGAAAALALHHSCVNSDMGATLDLVRSRPPLHGEAHR